MTVNKFTLLDGFDDYLVEGASFDGIFGFPNLLSISPESLPVILYLVPFSQRRKVPREHRHLVGVCFYEYDILFHTFEINPYKFLDELREFAFVISPDNSLYTDDPLTVQLINLYRNRAYGYYLQKNGIKVIPNVRWGDERSFSTSEFPEKWAFSGVPHNSVIAVGTYGCIRGKENTDLFKRGLISAIQTLEPRMVLVYGSMPNTIFDDLKSKTCFLHFDNWIKIKRGANTNEM